MTEIPAPPGKHDPDVLIPAGLIAGLVTFSLAMEAMVLRGYRRHPSPRVRRAIGALLVSDFVIAGFQFGKTRGRDAIETPEQRTARLGTVPPISPWQVALSLRNGVQVGLAVSRTRGPVASVLAGVAAQAVGTGLLFALRSRMPRLLEAQKRAAERKSEEKIADEMRKMSARFGGTTLS